MVNAWLAHEPMKPRQQLDYRRAVSKLEAWLGRVKLPAIIEPFTRKLAGRYVSEGFVGEGTHWRTANKDIACLSSYWKFLEGKGFATENVWTRQSVPERRTPVDERKRPFTDAEVRTLLAGEAPAFLKDAITIAALSGMRVEEIARQKVESIRAGCFTVRDAKTEAGNRSVPIHSALAGIVERRCKDKAPGDYLFPELPTPAPGSAIERSQKIVKAFTKYRRKLGVDDVVAGARQSRVDLHSLRRWFSKKATDALNGGAAGFSPWTLADVMGHNAEKMPLGMTMAHYPGQSDVDTRRACVEAVRLPA
ncbi:hypothetical protein D3273_03980 [Lichenibacterium minor]|uniref:Tyr recombinase domain-containing protein n=1 Tax=Lichenibacterium minor TaxID=2316528 RepID=A0A4Q2U9V7_9HYPH|nr:tyrosine-type recombinase/integrase [Lichenibacterium minor]RYC33629.1 hypothetical protein D3273_03980 [Lichenibacterium minor]